MAGDSVSLHHDTGISVFHAGLSHCSHYLLSLCTGAKITFPAGTVAPEKGESFSDSVFECGDDCLFCHMLCGLFILNW